MGAVRGSGFGLRGRWQRQDVADVVFKVVVRLQDARTGDLRDGV